MSILNFIRDRIEQACNIKHQILADHKLCGFIQKTIELAIEIYQHGNKILVAGNGGSAADAQHLACELVGRFYFDRPALAAIALTTDTSILTAIGNDYGYEKIFARQIEAHGVKGDMLIAISTSGSSPNIIEALHTAKKMKLATVGLTGETGGKMADLCDFCIKVPAQESPRIQEAHIMIGHIICAAIEENLFTKK